MSEMSETEQAVTPERCEVCTNPETVLCFCVYHNRMHCFECAAKARASVVAPQGDERPVINVAEPHDFIRGEQLDRRTDHAICHGYAITP